MKHLKTFEHYKLYTNNDVLPPHLPFKLGDYVYVKGDENKNIYKIAYYDEQMKMWFIDDAYLTKKPEMRRRVPYTKIELVPEDELNAAKFNL